MGTRAVPVPKPSESGPNRRLYRALRRSRGRGRNPSRNEGVSGTPRAAESRSTSWRSLVRAQYRPSHRQAVFRDVRSSEMGLFVIVVGVWSDFAIAWRKAAPRRRPGRAPRQYESAPLRNSVRARLQALTDSIREPLLTMRLWGQPVAGGGNEIGLVEAVSGLETIEPFATRCALVFPQHLHLLILFRALQRFPIRRSYEVGAEICEPARALTPL